MYIAYSVKHIYSLRALPVGPGPNCRVCQNAAAIRSEVRPAPHCSTQL